MIDTTKNNILIGHVLDCLKEVPDNSVDCVVTSPPYWGLRVYKTEPKIWGGDENCDHEWLEFFQKPRGGKNHPERTANVGANRKMNEMDLRGVGTSSCFCIKCNAWLGELGLEPMMELYISHLVEIFEAIRPKLKETGSLYIVLGDTYSGSGGSVGHTPETKNLGRKTFEYGAYPSQRMKSGMKLPPKSLCNIPARFAIAMQDKGWILRNQIIWAKKVVRENNETFGTAMPTSAKDRLATNYEIMYHFVKNKNYYYDLYAIRKPHKETSIARVFRGSSGNGKYGGEIYGGKQPAHTMSKERPNRTAEYLRYTRQIDGRDFIGTTEKFLNESGGNPGDVLQVNYEPLKFSHFAAFPQNLILRPILSSTSEKGCCSKCGKPYERIIERIPFEYKESESGANDGTFNKEPYKSNNPHRERLKIDTKFDREKQTAGRLAEYRQAKRKATKHDIATGRDKGNFSYEDPLHARPYSKMKELGWKPTCNCDVVKDESPKKSKDLSGMIDTPGGRKHYFSEQLKNPPDKNKLVEYLKKYKGERTYKEIDSRFDYDGDTASHWFTYPESEHGFSYPSPEDWMKLKKLLGFDGIFDKQMTETIKVLIDDKGMKGRMVGWNKSCRCEDKNIVPAVVLDPFGGTGTTGKVASRLDRRYILIELQRDYLPIMKERLNLDQVDLFDQKEIIISTVGQTKDSE